MNIEEISKSFRAEIISHREQIEKQFEDVKAQTELWTKSLQASMDYAVVQLGSKIQQEREVSDASKDDTETEMMSFRRQVETLIARVDDVHEKMYEFEQNKRNNLLFYGIPNDLKETPDSLLQIVASVIRSVLCISRDIPIARASRVLIGTTGQREK